jgi:hypothetical protein
MTTDLMLHEAIRLGAMLKPQSFGGRTKDHSCALQAACDAIGISYNLKSLIDPASTGQLCSKFPILGLQYPHPHPIGIKRPLASIIWWRNDISKWTREQIADWLEPIERAWLAEQAQTTQPHRLARQQRAKEVLA